MKNLLIGTNLTVFLYLASQSFERFVESHPTVSIPSLMGFPGFQCETTLFFTLMFVFIHILLASGRFVGNKFLKKVANEIKKLL